MNNQIRALIVEDSENDAFLMINEMKRCGLDVMYERVHSHDTMDAALKEKEWDIVIADYTMPLFDGINALKLLKERSSYTPFILVSGTIGEELAVDAIKAGADDYVMKSNLNRLFFSVKRVIKEHEEKRALRQMNDAMEALVKSIVLKTGEDASQAIVSSVKEWLGYEYVFLGQLIDDVNVKSLSIYAYEHLTQECMKNTQIAEKLYESVMRDRFYHYNGKGIKLFQKGCENCSKIIVKGFLGISVQDENCNNIGILWAASKNNTLILPPRAKDIMEILSNKVVSEIERLRTNEQIQKLSYAIEQSSSGIVITDTKGFVEYVNSSFTKQTGYSFDEILGKNVSILKSGKTLSDVYNGLWKTVLSGNEWRGELCNKKKNGEFYWESESISSVKNKAGEIVNFVAVKDDITKRRKMEEEIRQHNVELESLAEKRASQILELERQRMENDKLVVTGRLAAGFAHEINNPLSCIKGGFSLIKDSIPESHEYYKYVGIIDKEIDRVARTVRQLFDLNRPFQGEISTFDSIVSIDNTISMLKSLSNEYGVNLNIDCSENSLKVTMPEDSFNQVLFNIIKNAIEASPECGNIDIKVSSQNDRLNIIVSDQGYGISDESLSRIYEPFFTTKDRLFEVLSG